MNKLTAYLSRYHYRYPRTLVYMFQSSEYFIGEFVSWYLRVFDFREVEKRKKLKLTAKAKILLFLSYGLYILGVVVALLLLWPLSFVGFLQFLIAIIILPYFTVATLLVLVAIFNFAIQKPATYFIVNQAKKKLSEHSGIKIAVAGSFGKTTMREILKSVLSEEKKVAAPPGSYNTPLGISQFIKSLEGDEEVLVFELGEYYPGDITELCELIGPDIGVITGINEAHLEKFKSLESTTSTIFELADYLGSKPLYLNGESKLAVEAAGNQHIVYTRVGTSDFKITSSTTGLNGTIFVAESSSERIKLHSKLIGLHQIGPLVAAMDIADKLEISLPAIQSGISETKPFEHRLEPYTDSNGVTIIDDSYNGNPTGVEAAINFLSNLRDRRRIYITPGLVEMGERKEEVHKAIGKQLAKTGIEKVILIKSSSTNFIAAGLASSDYSGEIVWQDSMPEALDLLTHDTISGDVVLIQNDWPDQYV